MNGCQTANYPQQKPGCWGYPLDSTLMDFLQLALTHSWDLGVPLGPEKVHTFKIKENTFSFSCSSEPRRPPSYTLNAASIHPRAFVLAVLSP